MDKRYDVIVVGAGNGGLAAAANTAKAGLKPCCSFPLSDLVIEVPPVRK